MSYSKYQYNGNGTLTQAIVEYIRSHPGSKRYEIIEGIGYEGPPLFISAHLTRLRKQHVLQNSGGTKNCRWNVVDDKALPMFFAMAEDILQELKELHSSVRVMYLAQRLEDLLGESIDEDLES